MNPNVTREGIEVKPGQVWRDLDYRQDNARRVTVERVENGVAYVKSNRGATSRVAVKRMHKHATGYALVAEAT